ncbi:hypothetical protein [Streptomyces silaceus]|uniref:hypothetical protein n=1 Tax=Streptomyces silaceus TaxID=545123 RepID=UPI000A85774E|nr:hypothetical protein [Streptomyces silaceus]MCF3124171.1 hypothetical protein [Streptomyces arenae]
MRPGQAPDVGPGQGQRRAVLAHFVAGLRAEQDSWRRLATQGEAPALEKHRSQLAAVETLLAGGIEEARARLRTGELAGLPVFVLDLHHVWDYFRSKFALRRLAEYRDCLAVADELAWACYRAPLAAALGAGTAPAKEPPLVSFSRAAAPRAHRRGDQYRELLPRGGIHTGAGLRLVRGLPFPVIDVPWYHASHLPALLTVAHEAGHHVEDDFGLAPEIGERLADAALPDAERERWRRWAGEVFADVCACVVCGVAYPGVLAETLGALVPEPAGPASLDHPPAAVRLGVCRAALERAGHPPAANWPKPLAATLDESADGTPAAAEVAAALLDGGYERLGGASLPELLAPRRPMPGAFREYPDMVHAGRLLAGVPSRHQRIPGVVAAAALAFMTDPDGYDSRRVGARATAEALGLRPKGPRADVPRTPARGAAPDAEPGRLLLGALLGEP